MDQKAIKILFDRYWSSSGWRDEQILPEDFEYAKSEGVMFDPVSLSHDEIVKRAVVSVARTSKDQVVKAFLSSLTTRRLELRSALGSYASGNNLPVHKMVRGDGKSCVLCSEYDSREQIDLNVLNFERFKFGGVRHLQPLYIWLDLTLFGNEKIEDPTRQDIDLLKTILDQLSSLNSKKLSDAEKAIKFPKSNKNERVGLISTLGYCGILKVPNYPCFYEKYISRNQREHSNYSKSDWSFPADLWLPQYGINEKSVMHWFSDYL